jgi:hypothetical protein
MTKPKNPNSTLVQAWVPRNVHAWVTKEAKARGLSVASWIRSHLIDLRRNQLRDGTDKP